MRSTRWLHALVLGLGLFAGLALYHLFEKGYLGLSSVPTAGGHPGQTGGPSSSGQTEARLAADPHAGHEVDEHADHDENEVALSAAEIVEFGVGLATATGGTLATTLRLPGEVVIDPGALVHVAPPVAGVVRQVFKRLGEQVASGEMLATLSSRELAEAKARLIAIGGRLELADAILKRERALYEKKITAEREYLEARQARAEVAIDMRATKQRLMALGLTQQQVAQVSRTPDADLTQYELRAPTDGVILEKHITKGELLETDDRAFAIADLSRVWANLSVYQKDLPLVNPGQTVLVKAGFGIPDYQATIDYVGPIVAEDTRTATARVILDNREGRWRPGTFVSAELDIAGSAAEVVVPRSALHSVDGQNIVFVRSANGFEVRPVRVGRSDRQRVEVIHGLAVGEVYAAENTIVLKAELSKGAFGDGHAH